jgi:hypothetical protein
VPPGAIEIGLGAYAVVVNVDDPRTIETGVPVMLLPPEGDEGDPQPTLKPISPATMLSRSLMLFSIRCVRAKSLPCSHAAAPRVLRAKSSDHALPGSEKSKSFLTA